MSAKEKPQVIRVYKKKRREEGHHGGAWKVAFADFMTAMMTFFLVMWIVGMEESVKESIEGYFKDPTGKSQMMAGGMGLQGAPMGIGVKALTIQKQKQMFEAAKENIEDALSNSPELRELQSSVEVTLTDEGLRIELMDAQESFFFESGQATLKPRAVALLRLIALELSKLPNPVVLEGHTDAVPFAGRAGYSNWELSADRANAARRIMEDGALRDRQVTEVRGYAAVKLRDASRPTHFSNRRVTILAQYTDDPNILSTVARPKPQGGFDMPLTASELMQRAMDKKEP